MVIGATLDIDGIYENRAKGAAPTYRDPRRRADIDLKWPWPVQVSRSSATRSRSPSFDSRSAGSLL